MPVRIRLKLKPLLGPRAGDEIETTALVNSGYEAEAPEILLPLRLAEELGLWPPERLSLTSVLTPIGPGRLYVIGEVLEVRVLVPDRETEHVRASALISEHEREVLLSDYLTSALNIAIEDPRAGLWRFRDELPERARQSEPPRYY